MTALDFNKGVCSCKSEAGKDAALLSAKGVDGVLRQMVCSSCLVFTDPLSFSFNDPAVSNRYHICARSAAGLTQKEGNETQSASETLRTVTVGGKKKEKGI